MSQAPSTVILLSGGLDSGVCLGLLASEFGRTDEGGGIYPLSISYGQRHLIEQQAADALASYYAVHPVKRISLDPHLFAGSGSALLSLDDVEMPHKTYEELDASEGPSPTYVPFRNGAFLSLATAYALTVGASEVVYGAHAEDAHNWAYPDCTPEFIGAMANAIYVGTYHKVRLRTPLMNMNKRDIVRLGSELHIPFNLTYSCYEGGIFPCGKCPTCVARLQAFSDNHLTDPLRYQTGAM